MLPGQTISAKSMERASKSKTSMPNSEPKIQCSNTHCLTFNIQENRFCSRCKTPIIKRYLWAMAETIESDRVGELIGNRYLAISTRIFLDTKPGIQPQTPKEIPAKIIPYLQLFSDFPHIPQVYGQLDRTDIWLLEYGTVPTKKTGELIYSQLLPEITKLWSKATPLKQLHWLHQIAKLWKPLKDKDVASTLLNPWLIRVNGSFIQLLQLQTDTYKDENPSLQKLGTLWSQWTQYASPSIQGFLEELCQRLETKDITKPREIVAILDKAIAICGKSQEYSYQIFANSDSGPSRSNNEDASYPASQKIIDISSLETSLAIVCDGVGGHDGGEIASQETIKYLQKKISELSLDNQHSNPISTIKKLAQFTNEANDAISKRNDLEKRQERQRMGTTLVMALAKAHEVYLTHVGDSRIYLITRTGCHQVTIDDDLASREVRLGYALYRDALQYPSAGALIQALGMRDSTALHPNVRRLIVDEDCIFLLCSDGLSDFERVEQYWRSAVLPVLCHKADITRAAKTLMKIANEKNGHDNATVALVYCQVKPKSTETAKVLDWSEVSSVLEDTSLYSEPDSFVNPLPITEEIELEENPQPSVNECCDASDANKPNKSNHLKIIVVALFILVGTGLFSHFLPLNWLTNKDDIPKHSPELFKEDIPDAE